LECDPALVTGAALSCPATSTPSAARAAGDDLEPDDLRELTMPEHNFGRLPWVALPPDRIIADREEV